MATTRTTDCSLSNDSNIPLIEISTDRDSWSSISSQIVEALQTSGFLLLRSSEFPLELQEAAIQVTSELLVENNETTSTTTGSIVEGVIDHPTDPKRYLMFHALEEVSRQLEHCPNLRNAQNILVEYWKALERVKRQLLTCLAIGLGLEPDYFVRLHSKDQSALRLLHYPASNMNDTSITSSLLESSTTLITDPPPKIRCKPHSDYGSVTLLLTDGVPGLEAFIDGEWVAVPHVRGALVVNIGSLLQGWTNGKLLATLHRVVAPQECQGSWLPRTSLAFFADPDPDISTILQDTTATGNSLPEKETQFKTVAEYIERRSGGEGNQRIGLAFSKEEEDRVNGTKRLS